LVTAWLQTQNLPDGHRRELAGLAGRLPNALLDAIEHSSGYAQASARIWAVNALRAIPRQAGKTLDRLVTRARKWLGEVSRDVRPANQTSEDLERHRATRFRDRIGVDASGPVQAVGIDLVLVDMSDGAVAQTVPSILEGFPLTTTVTAFETAAVALAAGGRSPVWDGLRWLCLLNEVDLMQTAEALRVLSASVAARTAEFGVNPALPAKAASLLLWLTGEEADEVAASELGPELQRFPTYEADYLPNPGRSFFALERRHATGVLCDTSLPLLLRVRRTSELWLDPTFEPPQTFTVEARTLVASFDGTKLDCNAGNTIDDHNFEFFELVLARCAPEQLAAIVRAKLTRTDAPPESRYWRAIKAPTHFVLAGPAEAVAARVLRLSSRETDSGNELYASSQLLLLELHSEGGARQIGTMMDAELKDILLDYVHIQQPIPQDQAEALLARYGTGSQAQRRKGAKAQRRNLISLLQAARFEKSDILWDWLKGITRGSESELHGVAFRALASADSPRFGRELLNQDWSWSPSGDYWVNHYGSDALIKATLATPFDQVVPRLAPWRLLDAARTRGEDPNEVRMAASILSAVLAADGLTAPDPGALLTVDRTVDGAGPAFFSIAPIDLPQSPDDFASNLRRAMDPKAQQDAWQRAFNTATARISHARAAGASLYLANIAAEDMVLVVRHAPEFVELWLEGAADGTSDFRRRATLAEWAFLALCEALMRHDPDQGVLLWRALKHALTTRFIGAAKVDDMVQMVFRVPTSPAVATLRAELLGLDYSGTDKDLFDLALAANLNGQGEWLAAAIAKDAASPFAWRHKRAMVLEGFTVNNSLPQPLAWPDGPPRTDYDELRRRSARFRYLEACAHHWWQCYLAAPDAETAYAAWVLFVRAADRRAWAWVQRDSDSANGQDAFFQMKMTHAAINKSNVSQWMEKREDKLDKNFLGHTVQNGVGPWGKATT
jgi:hypothetical protein